MIPSGLTGHRPDLLEPVMVLLFGEARGIALVFSGLPVASGLAQHQNELNVILDDCVGFVGLAQKARSVLDLVPGV